MDCQANFSEVFQQSIKFSLKCTRMLLVSATPFPPILAKFPSILKLIYIPGRYMKHVIMDLFERPKVIKRECPLFYAVLKS